MAGLVLLLDLLPEMLTKLVVTADPLVPDERLQSGIDTMFLIEGLGLVVRFEVVILDGEASTLEQILRLKPVRAEMIGHNHAVEGSDLLMPL